jgi:ribosome biogenesis GTP-binding protein YsxC/EngB
LIKQAKFVKSSSKIKECPSETIPEYAFIGRSNVGKSSLINMLTDIKGLAKVSQTPGKTQHINHFIIDDSWYLVDLPGYGYAKASKTMRATFGEMISEYMLKRTNLVCVFVLVDVRHEPQKNDIEFVNWLGTNQISFVVVFTKTDKLGTNALRNSLEKYKRTMLVDWEELPPFFVTSAEKKIGREEILSYIAKMNLIVKTGASEAEM